MKQQNLYTWICNWIWLLLCEKLISELYTSDLWWPLFIIIIIALTYKVWIVLITWLGKFLLMRYFPEDFLVQPIKSIHVINKSYMNWEIKFFPFNYVSHCEMLSILDLWQKPFWAYNKVPSVILLIWLPNILCMHFIRKVIPCIYKPVIIF